MDPSKGRQPNQRAAALLSLLDTTEGSKLLSPERQQAVRQAVNDWLQSRGDDHLFTETLHALYRLAAQTVSDQKRRKTTLFSRFWNGQRN